MVDVVVDGKLRRGRQVSAVWLVPLVAILVGGWFVWQEWQNRGVTVLISFPSATGLAAGKTVVRHLEIEVGLVQAVRHNAAFDGVEVEALIERDVAPLLTEQAQFWVVRPRVDESGISGLGTLLSGAYIGLGSSPGYASQAARREFEGLEHPPSGASSREGLMVSLVSEDGAAMSEGRPIFHNGYRVGKVESVRYSAADGLLHGEAFIEAPFHVLVHANTRFWNISGVDIHSEGGKLEVRARSLEAVINGAMAFGTPEETGVGAPVGSGHTPFELYPSRGDAMRREWEHHFQMLVLYQDTVRGLEEGASVDYRGSQIGVVERIAFELIEQIPREDFSEEEIRTFPVPILLRIEPGRWAGNDNEAEIAHAIAGISEAVQGGLRATLRTENLLTGARFVSLEVLGEADTQAVREAGPWLVLPSKPTGLNPIGRQFGIVLEKLQTLPLDQTVTKLNTLLDTSRNALWQADGALGDFRAGAPLYDDLSQTLGQLRSTLQNVDQLVQVLKNKPNELIFSSQPEADRIPRRER